MKTAAIILVCTSLFLSGQVTKDPKEHAREVADLLLGGEYERLFETFNSEVKARLTVEILRDRVGPSLRQLGKINRIGDGEVRNVGQLTAVAIPVDFERADINLQVTLGADGLVAGLLLTPRQRSAEWKRPEYSNPDSFIEREVVIGEGEWQLPGTLTIPKGQQPAPAVVLVHGSGPNDRDETVGNNKPFRDLAEGLASRGVAVLGYEKRTRHHAAKITKLEDFSFEKETIEDAAKAIRMLREQPGIDPAKVYVLGHSLGGYAVPHIALSEEALGVAGGIIFAGNSRPIHELIVDQLSYLLSLNPDAEALQKQLEDARRLADLVRESKPGEELPKTMLGMPTSYILSMQAFEPSIVASKLQIPLLVLQGERDYQVTMRDFEGWQKALSKNQSVKFKSYPALNHLFVTGQGKSTPSEYSQPGHVDLEVIEDLAIWIKTGAL